MIKTPINLQELRRKIYVKAKAERIASRVQDGGVVLVGSDGVEKHFTRDVGYTTITKSDIACHQKSNQPNRLHKLLHEAIKKALCGKTARGV